MNIHRKSLASAAGLFLAILAGAGGTYLYLSFAEGPGPRLRRDCVSLVDTVLNEEPTVGTSDLEAELAKHGVTFPPLPLMSSSKTWQTDFDNYQATVRARKAKWKALEGTPEYDKAWNAVFGKKRDDAIRECVYKRATGEGVTVR